MSKRSSVSRQREGFKNFYGAGIGKGSGRKFDDCSMFSKDASKPRIALRKPIVCPLGVYGGE